MLAGDRNPNLTTNRTIEDVAMHKHQDIDRRSLALHRAVAVKIRKNPSLMQIALDNIARWEARGPGHSQPYLEEWKRIITKGVDFALRLIVEPSEHATALRQSSPFAGVLTEQERMSIIERWLAGAAKELTQAEAETPPLARQRRGRCSP